MTKTVPLKSSYKIAFLMKIVGEIIFSGSLVTAGFLLSPQFNGALQLTVATAMFWAPIILFGSGSFLLREAAASRSAYLVSKTRRFTLGYLSALAICAVVILVSFNSISILDGLIIYLWALMILDRDYFRGWQFNYLSDLSFQLIKGGGVAVLVAYLWAAEGASSSMVPFAVLVILSACLIINYIGALNIGASYFGVKINSRIFSFSEASRHCLKFGISDVPRLCLERVGVLLAAAFIGATEAGIYAVIVRLAMVSSLIVDPLRNVMRPPIVLAFAEENFELIENFYNSIFRKVLVIIVVLGVCLLTATMVAASVFESSILASTGLWLSLYGSRLSLAVLGQAGPILNFIEEQAVHSLMAVVALIAFFVLVIIPTELTLLRLAVAEMVVFMGYGVCAHVALKKKLQILKSAR